MIGIDLVNSHFKIRGRRVISNVLSILRCGLEQENGG